MTTQLLLIRHGETQWNSEQRIQGQTDVGLSERGREQARRLGERLRRIDVHAAYASDSARARETADIALELRGVPVQTLPELRERSFGEWESHLWTEIESEFPQDATRFFTDFETFAPPGGETWNQMQTRVFDTIRRLAETHTGQSVAVFTHGGPCKAAIFSALHLPPAQGRLWVAANASIQRLLWDEALSKTGRSPWKLVGFNDVAHLEEQETLSDPSAMDINEKVV